jgi:molecular chaperone GrpE
MDKEGILRIRCLGQPVDPTCMTVVEVVDDPTRPPGLVVDEVRTGYYWKSKVFRFAEVRAVRGKRSTEG